jgi:hypothetical protein
METVRYSTGTFFNLFPYLNLALAEVRVGAASEKINGPI